jgi:hypothetical protein
LHGHPFGFAADRTMPAARCGAVLERVVRSESAVTNHDATVIFAPTTSYDTVEDTRCIGEPARGGERAPARAADRMVECSGLAVAAAEPTTPDLE